MVYMCIHVGILNLARTGSMKLRNSFRRHGSIHRRDEHAVSHAVSNPVALIKCIVASAISMPRGCTPKT